MQALTEIKPGESCTVKWMVTGAKDSRMDGKT